MPGHPFLPSVRRSDSARETPHTRSGTRRSLNGPILRPHLVTASSSPARLPPKRIADRRGDCGRPNRKKKAPAGHAGLEASFPPLRTADRRSTLQAFFSSGHPVSGPMRPESLSHRPPVAVRSRPGKQSRIPHLLPPSAAPGDIVRSGGRNPAIFINFGAEKHACP